MKENKDTTESSEEDDTQRQLDEAFDAVCSVFHSMEDGMKKAVAKKLIDAISNQQHVLAIKSRMLAIKLGVLTRVVMVERREDKDLESVPADELNLTSVGINICGRFSKESIDRLMTHIEEFCDSEIPPPDDVKVLSGSEITGDPEAVGIGSHPGIVRTARGSSRE